MNFSNCRLLGGLSCLLLINACSTNSIAPGTYDIVYLEELEGIYSSEQVIVFDSEINLNDFPAAVVAWEGNYLANAGYPQQFTACIVRRLWAQDELYTKIGFTNPVKVEGAWKVVTRTYPDSQQWLSLSTNDGSCKAMNDGGSRPALRRCRLIRLGQPSLKRCQDAGIEMDEQTRP